MADLRKELKAALAAAAGQSETLAPVAEPATGDAVDPRDAEIAALKASVSELKSKGAGLAPPPGALPGGGLRPAGISNGHG